MARKKKKVIKEKPNAKSQASAKPQGKIFSKFKLGLVIRNLVLFILLFLVSYVLYVISDNIFEDIFYLLFIIFVFIALAFFIALLVLLVLKWIKR